MSTSALIAYKNEKGNYDVNAINFDGYIEGVGQILQEYWDDAEMAKNLCHDKEIRSLGPNKEETEFYKSYYGILRSRNDLSFEKLCNEAGNFSYTYVYEDDMWQILSEREIIEPY